MPAKFKARAILGTMFNVEDGQYWLEQQHKLLECDFTSGQIEKCPDTQKLHVQFFMYRKKDSSWGSLQKICHIEKARNPLASKDYSMKEASRIDGPWKFGIEPTFNVKGQKSLLTNKMILENNLVDLVKDEKMPLIQLPKMVIAKNLFNLMEKKDQVFTTPRGLWIWGNPGVGKSYGVRCAYPDAYLKQQNKWWDGYSGQTHVLLDDFDDNGKCLSHYLKIWSDCYPFAAEFKGGSANIRLERFIITSNHHPTSFFPPHENKELCDALLRRFRVFKIIKID